MKKALSLLLAAIMVLGLFAGCGNNAGTETPATTEAKAAETPTTGDTAPAEIVNIDFYIAAAPFNDQDRIMTKVNAILEEQIGVHLNLITLADYNTMQLMIDTGDNWDMCFTSYWLGDYFGNARKGAYADLTDYLQPGGLAEKTYSRIPESLWEGMKVNGSIYGFVNYQIWGSSKQMGLRFRSDIADEVGFDWQALKTMEIFDAFAKIEAEYLEPAMAAHPDMIAWEAQAGSNLYNNPQMLNSEAVGTTDIGWINYDDPTVVFNQYATDEFMQYCKIMREWYLKGWIPADAATNLETSANRQAGKYLFEMELGWPDDIDFPGQTRGMSMCSADFAPAVSVCATKRIMPAAAGPTAAVAVNAYSEHIDKCVELMELLNTNDALFQLIGIGEEGVDFDYDENGNVIYTNGGYYTYNEWQIAQSFDDEGFDRMPLSKGEVGEVQKATYEYIYAGDRDAIASPLSGFVFDDSNIRTEIANVQAVLDEMLLSLITGSVDPETKIPEFLSRLEAAGAGTIVAEKQAQMDAWLATK